MLHPELLSQIQDLSRSEKFEVVLLLVNDLAKEENHSQESANYLEQLRNSHQAANQLMSLLEKEKNIQNA